jgi:hypothetical protein
VTNNVSSENAGSRMEASSVGKHEYRAKKDESSTRRIWAAGFHYVTSRACLMGVLKLMNCLFL